MVNLTRIYTRTGDDGTTGSAAGAGSARTTPGSRRTPTATRPARSSAWRWRPAASTDDVAAVLTPGAERPVRRRRRPVHAGRADDPEYPPLRVVQAQVDALEADDRPLQRRPRAAALVRARRAVRRPPRTCTSRAPSYAGPSGRPGGAVEAHPRHGEPADGDATSTGSPTCCSSWPGYANRRAGDVLWVPGANR